MRCAACQLLKLFLNKGNPLLVAKIHEGGGTPVYICVFDGSFSEELKSWHGFNTDRHRTFVPVVPAMHRIRSKNNHIARFPVEFC
jgi:hypothetical protein